jgi:ubiquinone/menaquinone biosynthesis C-methylase UbiE
MAGISFDRVAATYDESRGGERRGQVIAAGVLTYLTSGRVVEIGIGTGVVALGLRQLGRDVIGVDLAPAMLARAVERVGPAVTVADAERLPFADGAADAALFVWVLQVVPDVARVLAEAARIVRPGGRVVVVPSTSIRDDEMWSIIQRMHAAFALQRPGESAAGVEAEGARCAALRHVTTDLALHEPFEATPAIEAQRIEERQSSSLFTVDDLTFDRFARPAIDALRALPDADTPRLVSSSQHVVVFERV